ncbi:putative transcriptional regulatory protein pdtaR [Botrimarina colliarenosi]|uniref:Putative transcriptional regulatory protein pdtaR n=1 Tax=Botrimarina colliarenosi TaxID=2528001 RepID=A0A5C6AMP7_9BACT|nr:response regulator [Botrimarina colliarenosi]TWT99443.1 putative transcriptional regulatory protein pdtaR [Botrimarina colliarenosi]
MEESQVASLRIALADDDPAMRDVLGRILRKLGHEVCFMAEDGTDLLEGLKDHRVDLVITDLDMPLLDGLAAAEEVAALGPPVILLSGHADFELICLESEPVVTALRKPVDVQSLEQAIAIAVAGHNPRE